MVVAVAARVRRAGRGSRVTERPDLLDVGAPVAQADVRRRGLPDRGGRDGAAVLRRLQVTEDVDATAGRVQLDLRRHGRRRRQATLRGVRRDQVGRDAQVVDAQRQRAASSRRTAGPAGRACSSLVRASVCTTIGAGPGLWTVTVTVRGRRRAAAPGRRQALQPADRPGRTSTVPVKFCGELLAGHRVLHHDDVPPPAGERVGHDVVQRGASRRWSGRRWSRSTGLAVRVDEHALEQVARVVGQGQRRRRGPACPAARRRRTRTSAPARAPGRCRR